MRLLKGGEATRDEINAVYLSLYELNSDSLTELAEFVELCGNENYEFLTPGLAIKLVELDLLKSDGRLDPKVRDITLSAIKGGGMDLELVWPGIPK